MKEQLLTEIKEDLKGCGKDFSSGNAPYICGKDKWIDGYGLCPICKERIKTKLQEWHRMASLWLDKIDDYQWDNNNTKIGYCDSKELSTFIQKIEKIAKEQGVELKWTPTNNN